MSTEAPVVPPAPVPQRSISPIPVILIVIALLVSAAFAYWRFIYFPSTPQYAVTQVIDAGRAKDYQQVYDRLKLTGPLKALIRGPDDLKRYAGQYPGLIPDVHEYRITNSDTKENRATVTANVKSTQRGRTVENRVDFQVVRDEGFWRLDGEWLLREAIRHGLGGALLGGAED